ncbi:DUF3892 domain-containing protein [Mycetocola tolaasinivorans]|uniref:DUF3892 domain-containing protein n=1 Tax=Mycetocola tolaasinivorans TaxID=76635 RepID=A0A3L7ADI2_9MICO|nr:DUF3892 domain-containing protein [Mycetocola tolaasinivorans]RLP77860.1 DUF3892 domain-containing protein [Mycetocola tolaasinivorans]
MVSNNITVGVGNLAHTKLTEWSNMIYIRRVRVAYPGTRNEHITDVQYSDGTGGILKAVTRASMVEYIDNGNSVRTHNDHTGAQAEVITRSNGVRYLTTIANERESDNLLALPRFQ